MLGEKQVQNQLRRDARLKTKDSGARARRCGWVLSARASSSREEAQTQHPYVTEAHSSMRTCKPGAGQPTHAAGPWAAATRATAWSTVGGWGAAVLGWGPAGAWLGSCMKVMEEQASVMPYAEMSCAAGKSRRTPT